MPQLIEFDNAVDLVKSLSLPLTNTETRSLDEAMGCVLAERLVADRDLPPFNRAAMDGYAFVHASASKSMPIAGARRAGEVKAIDVPPGTCIEISTGAAVPDPCDTVIPFELTNRGDPVRIDGDLPVSGRHIHQQGSDAVAGDVLVRPGTSLGPAEIGIAAMAGHVALSVRGAPRVCLLTSGDEVVQEGAMPAPHQIRNSNGPMVSALVRRIGGRIEHHQHLRDDLESTTQSIRRASDSCDVIVTTGGISAGRHDYLPDAFESLGCQWLISGVGMQPGKPLRIGSLGECTVVCLPGNPVSALVTAAVFLTPILQKYLGIEPGPNWRSVELAEDAKSNPNRTLLRPALLKDSTHVSIPKWQGSGDLVHAAGTNGIVRLPQTNHAPAGERVSFAPWP
ncbi:MAG: molybdopterin molybdotransferase MoeA [Planctomycetes bacterium]|nr:molybdopterin molybdotransferase MoeA [Planctomycetota bacterium]